MDRSSWITEHFIIQSTNSGHDLINFRCHFADLAPHEVRFAWLVEVQGKEHKPHSPEILKHDEEHATNKIMRIARSSGLQT
jgi:hypothetical protein